MSKGCILKIKKLRIKKLEIMKKSVLLLAVIAFFTSLSFTSNGANKTVQLQNENCIVSQQGPKGQRMTPEERINKQMATYQKKLSLTEDQATSIKAVLTENAETMNAKMKAAKESGTRPDRSEMGKLKEKENVAIRALLNDDQKTTFDTLLKEEKEKMQQRRSNRNK